NVNFELFDKSKRRKNDDDDDKIAKDANELLRKMNKRFGNRNKGNENDEDDGKPLDFKNLSPKYYLYTALALAFLVSLVYAYKKASPNNEIDFDTFYNDYLRVGR